MREGDDDATRHAVIIPSLGRPQVLMETVKNVLRQEPLPDEILVVITQESDASPELKELPKVRVIIGRKGLTLQRNDGIKKLSPEIQYVTFFDDDMELHKHYLKQIRTFLNAHDEVVLACGKLLANGGLDRNEAKSLVQESEQQPLADSWTYREWAYGCNMSVRRSVLSSTGFDERLRLYAWLEDSDFCMACKEHGKIAKLDAAVGVHLMVSSGRVSGVRMGYSQLVNSYYIHKKWKRSMWGCFRGLWMPALVANLLKWPFDRQVDRLGRLRGNLQAIWDLARGKCEPERIEKM